MNTQLRGEYTSASNAQADALCAGRHMAQKGKPDIRTSDADFGTAIHKALAIQDSAGLDMEQEDIYESCLKIEKNVVAQFFPELAGTVLTPLRETRMWVGWENWKHSAQLDVAYRHQTKALIIEYKTLPGEVAESPKNEQLRDQVCVCYANTPLLEMIGVAVVQPLVTHSPQICVYKKDDIEKAMNYLYVRVRRSNDPNAARTAGPVQCKFCRAKPDCKEYAAYASSLSVTPIIKKIQPSILASPVSSWTPDQRSIFMDHLSFMQSWMETCKSEIKQKLKEDPESVPGYKLKEGAKRSTIINPQLVYDAFLAAGGTSQQFMTCLEISKTDLKASLREAKKLKGKALDNELDAIIGSNFTVKQTEPSIVKK